MTAAMITQLLIQYGPGAVKLIEQLVADWGKPALTLEEVKNICGIAKTSYAQYIADAGGPPVAG